MGAAAASPAPPTGPRILFQAESDGIGSSARAKKMVFLAEEAGQYVFDGGTRSGIVQIAYRIEEDPDNPRVVMTVRGVGYRAGSVV